jgi:hypothetical protein
MKNVTSHGEGPRGVKNRPKGVSFYLNGPLKAKCQMRMCLICVEVLSFYVKVKVCRRWPNPFKPLNGLRINPQDLLFHLSLVMFELKVIIHLNYHFKNNFLDNV